MTFAIDQVQVALWVKFSGDDISKYFSYISQKTGFDISSKLSPFNLHEMSNHVFWKKRRKIATFVATALQWRTNIHTLKHWVYFCSQVNTKLNSSQSHFL